MSHGVEEGERRPLMLCCSQQPDGQELLLQKEDGNLLLLIRALNVQQGNIISP